MAVAKSRQRFAGYVNVAPFRAARGYGFEITLSPRAAKILNRSGGRNNRFDLSSEEVFLFLIFRDFSWHFMLEK